jgi:hypothetical protein
MKRMIAVALCVLVTSLAFSQSQSGQYERAKLFKTYTTFLATSDDTTGFVTVPIVDVLNASEVVFVAMQTDSVNADLYFLGYNLGVTDSAGNREEIDMYADSISVNINNGSINGTSPKYTVIPLKDATVNRLAGCTSFKVGTVFKATGQGTTTGRQLKYYLFWRK